MRRAWHLLLNVCLWAFFCISLLPLFLVALLIWLVTYPFDPNRRVLQWWSCWWGRFYIWANPFWSVTAKNVDLADPRKAYVIVSNHQSMVDIMVMYRSMLHFKWVSKDIMFKVPFLGWNMILNGYVPIKRGDPKSREVCMAKCAAWLKKGSSVVFFPEGTRSETGEMRPFKLGAFQLAVETGSDILPVVIRGSRDALPKHSAIIDTHSDMEIEVLPPIPVDVNPSEDLKAQAERYSDRAREAIAKALDKDDLG